MKQLSYFLCIGLVATVLSCSKDDEEEDKLPPQNVPTDTIVPNGAKNEDFKYYGAEI